MRVLACSLESYMRARACNLGSYMRARACKSWHLTCGHVRVNLALVVHTSAAETKHFLWKMLSFCVWGMHKLGCALPPTTCRGVRVTFIDLHAGTCVFVHHFLTWPYMRACAFLPVSSITNYRVYVYWALYKLFQIHSNGTSEWHIFSMVSYIYIYSPN